MDVYFHENFYEVYAPDPAAAAGRMEAIVEAIAPHVDFQTISAASHADLLAAHTAGHIERIRRQGRYEIAALAAGGAIQAAIAGMQAPSFALIRPPGHHASADSCWGFCFFNNMAVSLLHLYARGLIERAFVLDFDLHTGDGNVNILGLKRWVEILNPDAYDRSAYLRQVESALLGVDADVIAVSAGFDHHVRDWGGLLATDDYRTMGAWVAEAARRNRAGCFGVLEGGYNDDVLGESVLAFLEGMGL